jgi:hypothetical protein
MAIRIVSFPTVMVLTNGERVEDGSNNSEQKDGTQVIEEQAVRHEVTGIQYDRRQHVQEKCIGGEGRNIHVPCLSEKHTNDHPHSNQQARFGEDSGEFRRHVETWNKQKQLS